MNDGNYGGLVVVAFCACLLLACAGGIIVGAVVTLIRS